MSRLPVSTGRRLALAGALAAVGALCLVLLRGPDDGTSPPPEQGPLASAKVGSADSGEPTRDRPIAGPVRAPSASEEADDASEEEGTEPRPSRREQYTAAFDRKIGRIQARIAEDCPEHDSLTHLFEDFGAVRDRIVESAVATDSGQKTKAEQRQFERAQLRELDEKVCRTIATLSLPRQCQRHFQGCERAL